MQYNFTLKCTYEVKYLDEVKFDDPKVILAVSNIFFNIGIQLPLSASLSFSGVEPLYEKGWLDKFDQF